MSAQPKGAAQHAAALEQDTADELEQIMNDIEELQEEMASEEATEATRKAPPPAAAAPRPRPALKSVPTPSDDAEEPILETTMADFHGSSDDASLEDTLVGLEEEAPATGASLLDADLEASLADDSGALEEVEDEVSKIVDQISVKKEKPMTAMKRTEAPPGAAQEGSLTLSVTGAMTLKLRFEGGEQDVELAMTGDALVVKLSDGTEFRIPVKTGRAAA
ncbi:MAG: hypothetical protein IT285_04640 [Bdellovibrionales bacterium]|nr:hypothetical protein [Bdellovibrionales bacterium]